MYFKICALYFSPFQIAEKQCLAKAAKFPVKKPREHAFFALCGMSVGATELWCSANGLRLSVCGKENENCGMGGGGFPAAIMLRESFWPHFLFPCANVRDSQLLFPRRGTEVREQNRAKCKCPTQSGIRIFRRRHRALFLSAKNAAAKSLETKHSGHRLQELRAQDSGLRRRKRRNCWQNIALRQISEREALEPMLSENIIKSQIADNHTLSTIQSKFKFF